MDSQSGNHHELLPGRLRQRRTELRLSQSEAARRAGVGRMAWWEWEKGRRLPYDTNYAGIEDAMQWERGDVDGLLREGKDPHPLDANPDLTEVATRMFTAIDETFKAWGFEMTPAMLEVWHAEVDRQTGGRRRPESAPSAKSTQSDEDSDR